MIHRPKPDPLLTPQEEVNDLVNQLADYIDLKFMTKDAKDAACFVHFRGVDPDVRALFKRATNVPMCVCSSMWGPASSMEVTRRESGEKPGGQVAILIISEKPAAYRMW